MRKVFLTTFIVECRAINTIWRRNSISLAHVSFIVFGFWSSPNYTPIKYMCLIQQSNPNNTHTCLRLGSNKCLDEARIVTPQPIFHPTKAVYIAGAVVCAVQFIRRSSFWCRPPLRKSGTTPQAIPNNSPSCPLRWLYWLVIWRVDEVDEP